MGPALAKLTDLGLLLASLGVTGAGLLALAGLLFLVLGHRLFRLGAGLVGAAGAALGVSVALRHWHPALPVGPQLVTALFAVVFFIAGLASPQVAMVLAASAAGLAAGIAGAQASPAHGDLVILAGCLAGALVAGVLWTTLPTLIPPLVGGLALAAGAWGLTGASGLSPGLFRLPVVWIALAGVLVVVGVAVERGRWARREKKRLGGGAQAEREAKARREAEMRERHRKYFE